LLQDLLVAALHEIGLKRYWYLDVDVGVDVLLWNQFDLGVVLGDSTWTYLDGG
jgi:hypothetical protein